MWWLDYCKQLLDAADICVASLTLKPWCAALLAHGDVAHTITDRYPYDLSFGLTYEGAGRPATAAWRRVLETGRLLPSTAIKVPNWSITEPAP